MKGYFTKTRIISIVIIALVTALTAVLCVVVGGPLVRFASEPEQFRQWMAGHGVWGELAYLGMVVLQLVIAILPGDPFEIVAGYAFGAVRGTLLCLIGEAIGSILVILLVRKFGMRLVEVFFSKDKIKSLKFLQSSPRNAIIFSIIFIMPGTPKDLLCYYAGLTDINLPLLLLVTTVGRIPAVITSTIGGDALGNQSYLFAGIVFAVTAVISVAGILIYNAICKRREGED